MVYPATSQVTYKNSAFSNLPLPTVAAFVLGFFFLYLLIYLCLVLGSLLCSATTKLSGIKEITTANYVVAIVLYNNNNSRMRMHTRSGIRRTISLNFRNSMLRNVFYVILYWLYNLKSVEHDQNEETNALHLMWEISILRIFLQCFLYLYWNLLKILDQMTSVSWSVDTVPESRNELIY